MQEFGLDRGGGRGFLVVPASAETDDSTEKDLSHHFPNPSNCDISGDNSGHEIEPITDTDDSGLPVNIRLKIVLGNDRIVYEKMYVEIKGQNTLFLASL